MTKGLSQEQVQIYRRDGCIFPITFMSPMEVEQHRGRLEAAEAERGGMHYMTKPYLVFTSAAEIGRHPGLLDAVEGVLGPDILLWDSAYIIKEPNNQRFVSWHQDLTYWGLDSDRLVTAWVALSPSTSENGCMKFIPGSHLLGKQEHRDTYAEDNILHRGQEIAGVDGSQAIDIVLQPGQASLHHGWVAHGSGPNLSSERRIGLTLQYTAPNVRQVVGERESATLVRGVDSFGHFEAEPLCRSDFAPEALAYQQEVERRKHAVYDKA